MLLLKKNASQTVTNMLDSSKCDAAFRRTIFCTCFVRLVPHERRLVLTMHQLVNPSISLSVLQQFMSALAKILLNVVPAGIATFGLQ